jgi:hypothetical protein
MDPSRALLAENLLISAYDMLKKRRLTGIWRVVIGTKGWL